nr:hypothetical protein [Tanacetum cinerariifolium]
GGGIVQGGAPAHVVHGLYHLVDVAAHGDFDAVFTGGAPEGFLVIARLGNGRLQAAGAVIDAVAAVGESTGPTDMGKGC